MTVLLGLLTPAEASDGKVYPGAACVAMFGHQQDDLDYPSEAAADPLMADSSDEERTDAQLQLLDASISSESPDPPFERSAWLEIATILDGDAFAGSSLRNLTCSRSLCRLVVDHEAPELARTFQGRFMRSLSGQFGGLFADWQAGEAGGSTLVYLARRGYRIPRL